MTLDSVEQNLAFSVIINLAHTNTLELVSAHRYIIETVSRSHGCHQGSKSALLTDFRKFPLSRREGRKKKRALSEEGATQSEIS